MLHVLAVTFIPARWRFIAINHCQIDSNVSVSEI